VEYLLSSFLQAFIFFSLIANFCQKKSSVRIVEFALNVLMFLLNFALQILNRQSFGKLSVVYFLCTLMIFSKKYLELSRSTHIKNKNFCSLLFRVAPNVIVLIWTYFEFKNSEQLTYENIFYYLKHCWDSTEEIFQEFKALLPTRKKNEKNLTNDLSCDTNRSMPLTYAPTPSAGNNVPILYKTPHFLRFRVKPGIPRRIRDNRRMRRLGISRSV
jgi:hypothetical protein